MPEFVATVVLPNRSPLFAPNPDRALSACHACVYKMDPQALSELFATTYNADPNIRKRAELQIRAVRTIAHAKDASDASHTAFQGTRHDRRRYANH